MALSPADADTLARRGLDALRRGDGATAQPIFARLAVEAPAGPKPWLPLAQACRLTGDAAAEARALEQLLRAEPRSLPGLLLMGDRKRLDGDDRAAWSFYTAALNQAQAAGQPPAPALRPLLEAAQAYLGQAQARFAAHLEAAAGDGGSARVREAVDLLLGRVPLHVQQPSSFYFPGLAQRAFFERDEFAWVPAIEAAYPAIRAELEALAEDPAFAPYVEGAADRPQPANPLLGDAGWSALYLWKAGTPVDANAARCPATMAALERAPMPRVPGRSPGVLFSRLRPGTHIRPHHGMLNTRLICHLPLVVPPGCGIRVGAHTRVWREGELLIFDDSFEHEAWNRGTGTRTVLLFEVWRPELTADEREQLARVFGAVETYVGFPED
jgi:hypothetical protein